MPALWTHREPVGYSVINCPVCWELREAEVFRCHRQLIPRRNPPKNPKHPPWHELVCRECGFRERIDEPELSTSSTADLPMHMLIEDHRPEIVELAAEREAREAPVLEGKASPSEREAVLAARIREMGPAERAESQAGTRFALIFLSYFIATMLIGISGITLYTFRSGSPSPWSLYGSLVVPPFVLGTVCLIFGSWIVGLSTAGLRKKQLADLNELVARSLAPFGPHKREIENARSSAGVYGTVFKNWKTEYVIEKIRSINS